MSASTSDHFQKLGGASSLVNTPRVTSTRSGGGSTLAVDNCNWDQTTGKTFATYQVDTSGNVVNGTEIIWNGIVTGTTSIGSLTRLSGAADSGNAIGDYVELLPSSAWANSLVGGILTHADQDGTLKAGAVDDSTVLADSVVATAKIAAGAVTTAKIATNAVTSTLLALSNALDATNGVQSQANAGTAGGSLWWINLGGLKILWANSASTATVTGGTSMGFTLPTFFTTVQTAFCSANNPNATGSIYSEVDTFSTTAAAVKVTPATNTNVKIALLMIGT